MKSWVSLSNAVSFRIVIIETKFGDFTYLKSSGMFVIPIRYSIELSKTKIVISAYLFPSTSFLSMYRTSLCPNFLVLPCLIPLLPE